MLVSMDGRDHVRQRRLISAGFTPRMVGRLEAQAREWTVAIVERARELGTCEFVQDVAYQLPMHMIADIVGIPVEDREWLFGLTKELLQGGDTSQIASPEKLLTIQGQMFEYAQELGRRKRSDPRDDVWTILSTVEVETDDGECTSLGEIELDMFFFLLTIAGSETTRNAISGGLIALLDHPDQLAALRCDPNAMRPRWRRSSVGLRRLPTFRAGQPAQRLSEAFRSMKATASRCGIHRRTEMRKPSRSRSVSTPRDRRTTMSRSVAADRTTPLVRTLPAAKWRSCLRNSSHARPKLRFSRLPPTAVCRSTIPSSAPYASYRYDWPNDRAGQAPTGAIGYGLMIQSSNDSRSLRPGVRGWTR